MLIQRALAFLLAFSTIKAVPPPGYKSNLDVIDENPPKYEYEYKIENDQGIGQGKIETSDGILASGRYYVEGQNSSQNVEYVADDWGYHPYVEYRNIGPHSQTVMHIALDKEAIKTLNNKHISKLVTNLGERNNNHIEKVTEHNNLEQQQVEANNKVVVVQQDAQEDSARQQTTSISANMAQEEASHQIPHENRSPSKYTDQRFESEPKQNSVDYVQPQYNYYTNLADVLPQPDYGFLNENSNFQGWQENARFIYIPQPQNIPPQLNGNVLVEPMMYHTLPEHQIRQNSEQQDNFETAAFHANTNKETNQLKESNDGTVLQVKYAGGYGTKINNKIRSKSHTFRFLERVKNLISGQDVLDINTATQADLETSTLSRDTIPVIVPSNESSKIDTHNPLPLSPTNQSPQDDEANKELALSEQPIIVPDVDYQSSTIASDISQDNDQSTVIVTPRSISSALLAPLTAGVKLQGFSNDAVKSHVASKNFVVDVQRSIPYYLGKIEYYDSDAQSKDRNVTATATQHLKLGYFLQQPIIETPKAEALVQQPSEPDTFSQTFKSVKPELKLKSNVQNQEESQQLPVKIEAEVEKKTLQYSDRPRPEPSDDMTKQYPMYIPIQQSVPVQVTEKQKPPLPLYTETPVPVAKPVIQYIPTPYPVTFQLPVSLPQSFYLPLDLSKPYPVDVTNYVAPTQYPVQITAETPRINRPNSVLFRNNQNLKRPKMQFENLATAASLRSVNKVQCVDLHLFGINKPFCPKLNNNNYIGLIPPKIQTPFHYFNVTKGNVRRQRTAQNAFESSIRWEYGFMPPLIPSLEIDEQGNPVEKHSK